MFTVTGVKQELQRWFTDILTDPRRNKIGTPIPNFSPKMLTADKSWNACWPKSCDISSESSMERHWYNLNKKNVRKLSQDVIPSYSLSLVSLLLPITKNYITLFCWFLQAIGPICALCICRVLFVCFTCIKQFCPLGKRTNYYQIENISTSENTSSA